MPVNHRKINPSRGRKRLASLRNELKETVEAIRQEEVFDADARTGGPAREELMKRFPVLNGGKP